MGYVQYSGEYRPCPLKFDFINHLQLGINIEPDIIQPTEPSCTKFGYIDDRLPIIFATQVAFWDAWFDRNIEIKSASCKEREVSSHRKGASIELNSQREPSPIVEIRSLTNGDVHQVIPIWDIKNSKTKDTETPTGRVVLQFYK